MALAAKSFRSSSSVDLIAAVNTWLATKVAGASVIITQVDIVQNLLPRRMLKQAEFQCVITFNDAGATPQATPFLLQFAKATNPTDLDTAMAAILATASIDFATGFRIISEDEPSQVPTMLAWSLISLDADAFNNYIPQ